MFNFPISIQYCILGALAVLLVKFIDDSRLKPGKRPDYLSPLYYLRCVLWLLLAGLLGYVYFANEPIFSNRLIYFHTGASAQLIVRKLKESLPFDLNIKSRD